MLRKKKEKNWQDAYLDEIISWLLFSLRTQGFLLSVNSRTDLTHDIRHFCTDLRTHGIEAWSRGFSGGKVVKSANT